MIHLVPRELTDWYDLLVIFRAVFQSLAFINIAIVNDQEDDKREHDDHLTTELVSVDLRQDCFIGICLHVGIVSDNIPADNYLHEDHRLVQVASWLLNLQVREDRGYKWTSGQNILVLII